MIQVVASGKTPTTTDESRVDLPELNTKKPGKLRLKWVKEVGKQARRVARCLKDKPHLVRQESMGRSVEGSREVARQDDWGAQAAQLGAAGRWPPCAAFLLPTDFARLATRSRTA